MALSAARCSAACCLVLAAGSQAGEFRNVTAGGTLRHGVYGRIEARGGAQPPLIYERPVTAAQPVPVIKGKPPAYLYVPPGHVRKWDMHCHKWKACDEPVLFVRMDNSPSRLGLWKARDPADATRQLSAGPAFRSSHR